MPFITPLTVSVKYVNLKQMTSQQTLMLSDNFSYSSSPCANSRLAVSGRNIPHRLLSCNYS